MAEIYEIVSKVSFVLSALLFILLIVFTIKDKIISIFMEITGIKAKKAMKQQEKLLKEMQSNETTEEDEDESDIWEEDEVTSKLASSEFKIIKKIKYIHSDVNIENYVTNN